MCNVCELFFPINLKDAFLNDVRGHLRNPRNNYEEPLRCRGLNCPYGTTRYHLFKRHIETVHPNGLALLFIENL